MSILLDKLCITASSLRSVIDGGKWEGPTQLDRMYKSAITTIRRLVNAESDSNYIMREGSNMEDVIIERLFSDNQIFQCQKICEKTFIVGGVSIPFRATIDVYDTNTNTIIEIKCAVRKKPDFTNLNSWVNDDYCKYYNVQAQIQMLCCDGFEKMHFFVHSQVAEKIDRDKSNFLSKPWQKEDDFFEKHQDVILEYWELLTNLYNRYLDGDDEIKLLVHKYDNNNKDNKVKFCAEILNTIDTYIDIYHQKMILENDLERKKLLIIAQLQNKGFGCHLSVDLGKVSIKKIPKSTSYLYSKIVKDKNIISTLTDEELQLYSKEIEERYTVRIKSQKDELF